MGFFSLHKNEIPEIRSFVCSLIRSFVRPLIYY